MSHCFEIASHQMKKTTRLLVLCMAIYLVYDIATTHGPSLGAFLLTEKQHSDSKIMIERRALYSRISPDSLAASRFYQSTPEERAEEEAFEVEQVGLARRWLSDLDIEKRIMGVEQLAAYPSPRSENLLVGALKKDPEPQIRVLAAEHLSYMRQPSLGAQEALIAALYDINEEVRMSAFNTLQYYLASSEQEGDAQRIVGLLKHQMQNGKLPLNTRKVIEDYLSDQAET